MATALDQNAPRPQDEATWFEADVNIKDVLAHLADLRARTDGGSDPRAVSSVLNLVALAPRDDDLPEVERAIVDLAEHQPSRAIVVSEGPEGDAPGIDAGVSVRSADDEHGRRVRVERVTLIVRGTARAGITSAVEPLLRSDLPTFLWWPGSLESCTDLLESLCGLADRLVSEGTRSSDPVAALTALSRWVRDSRATITDLAWAAITPWRQMLVQMLGPNELERLSSAPAVLHVAHGAPTAPLEALLLAGWLRAGLGEGLAVEFQARPNVDERLIAVEIEGASGRRLGIERIEGRSAAAVTVTAGAGKPRRRILPMPIPVTARLLAGELEYVERDISFERSLTNAMELIS